LHKVKFMLKFPCSIIGCFIIFARARTHARTRARTHTHTHTHIHGILLKVLLAKISEIERDEILIF